MYGMILWTTLPLIKADTRSVDYSRHEAQAGLSIRRCRRICEVHGLGLGQSPV